MIVSANDIKRKGVSLIGSLIDEFDEVVISVRGKQKYVVLDIEKYKELRNNELELAYLEARKDIKEGKYHTDINKHIESISK